QLFFQARFVEDINEKIAFGFIISNAKGLEIFGTKGGFYDVWIPPGKCGQVVECTAKINMMLVPQEYFLSVALAPDEGSTADNNFYDCRFDCLHFKVIGESLCFSTSVVDLNAALSVTSIAEP
ncbi:MAG: Wzt carbohydrate-binding domain-containing protein, partial [Desulfobacterales bacterium]